MGQPTGISISPQSARFGGILGAARRSQPIELPRLDDGVLRCLALWLFMPVLLGANPVGTPAAGMPEIVPPPSPETPSAPSLRNASYCAGEYADDLSALIPKARELEQETPAYTFCIRTAATYECPSYGPDGNLRRKKRNVIAHGTGFAFRQQSGDTLLLTNDHVAEWPLVTDDDHPADDVPVGCKRVADSLKIVDNEDDSYDRDDIALTRVVVDPQLDVAILKAKGPLPVLPWKIGHSAGLKERNIVDVRGFPLGVFKATNVGKVISAYDHDSYKDWEHDDFVIDALLSPGNSGSPVFAISCKTGEFELVGIYHAGYSRGSALNVAIGIDQIRDLMTTLKRVPRAKPEASMALDQTARERMASASKLTLEPFFPLGSMIAAVRARDDGVLLYEILNRDFPFRAYPVLVFEDLPPIDPVAFGTPGRVWIGNVQGLKAYARSDLDGDTQSQLSKLLEGLRRDSVASFAVRSADQDASSSREKFERTERLEKVLQKASASYADLSQTALDLVERLAPQPGQPCVDFRAILFPPPPSNDQPASALAASTSAPGVAATAANSASSGPQGPSPTSPPKTAQAANRNDLVR
jgi:S1-C subfamily serine protease